MPEVTSLNKPRKSLRSLTKKVETKEANPYYYPKTSLYTRQEFELLDTIYSDEPSSAFEEKIDRETLSFNDNFWSQNKEEDLIYYPQNNNLFKNITWFLSGVILTSVIWFVFYTVKVHEIQTKDNTRIVYHKTAETKVEKPVVKEVTKQPEIKPVQKSGGSWFKLKPKNQISSKPITPASVRFHTVGNGDSLWSIANKYYSNPSQANINKIMKANNMKKIGLLQPAQKLAIPE